MSNEIATTKAQEKPQMLATSPTPEMLIAQAIEKNVPVETLERLLSLKERLDAAAAKQAYNEAMAAFQSECPVIKKTKSVRTKSGTVAYKYAPIESTVKQVKGLVQKHGFRYSTLTELLKGPEGTTVKAICRVTHSMGHVEDTPMEVPLGTKTDVMSQSQVVSAAGTFAKRYAFLNAFGIMTADDDTDGPDAEEEKKTDNKATQEQKDEIDRLGALAGLTKAYVSQRVRDLYGVSYVDLTKVQADGVIAMLKKSVGNKK
jgi:hypothetical protein